MEEMLYTVAETAKILKTNQGLVYKLIAQGHIKTLKLGRIKIRKAELERFIEWAEGKEFDDEGAVGDDSNVENLQRERNDKNANA